MKQICLCLKKNMDINLFWHPCIRGYCNTKESIVLFSVLKKEGDSSDEILFYENSLISMAKDWEEIGDIKKFIPIGWLGYSGGYVLYEVSSHNIFLENMDVDGEVEDKPIANSLKELINNMNVNPNIREKEKNKCCL
ncbi:uncharacterized protein BN751_00795 [Coprococcus eutactus CAG:665]|nr:uncharacterized protein BN751_00795 [Coprococcus eutactus CAG:665]